MAEPIRSLHESVHEPAGSSGVRATTASATPTLTVAPRAPRRLLGYLAGLNTPKVVLWCYLIWYFSVLTRYFEPSPRLWLSSLGISAIIGTGLYLSTARSGKVKTHLEPWQVGRLYLMPFCVSSFAALIKDRGFVLIFHPSWSANLQTVALCSLFVVSVEITKAYADNAARD